MSRGVSGKHDGRRKLRLVVWTAEREATLRRMWADPWNFNTEEIARRFDTSTHLLREKVERLKLGPRPERVGESQHYVPPKRTKMEMIRERQRASFELKRRRKMGLKDPVSVVADARGIGVGATLLIKDVDLKTRALIDAAVDAGRVQRVLPSATSYEVAPMRHDIAVTSSRAVDPRAARWPEEGQRRALAAGVSGSAGVVVRTLAAQWGTPVTDAEIRAALGSTVPDSHQISGMVSAARRSLAPLGIEITRALRGSDSLGKVGRAMVWTPRGMQQMESKHGS